MRPICSGCRREFKNYQGLTLHRNTCKKAIPHFERALKRQSAWFEKEEAAKRARRDAERLAEDLGGGGGLTDPNLEVHTC